MMNAKINFKNNNEAFAYAIYMMVGSYYNDCSCKNERIEDKYYLSYCEAGAKLQYQLEEQAERYAKKKIFDRYKKLDKEYLLENVSVEFKLYKSGIKVSFVGRNYKLCMLCKVKGQRFILKHVLKAKNELTDKLNEAA